jgi:HD-GYP domain-containing protein (c-di-GMP phosphodiesterase class II)
VVEWTLRLASKLGFREEELLSIRWGALLHDIGKLGISDFVLQKPVPLTEEE